MTTLVIAVPLYLNPWSATNYEPDKALLLQWLAALAAAGFFLCLVPAGFAAAVVPGGRVGLEPAGGWRHAAGGIARRVGQATRRFLSDGVVVAAAAWFAARALSTALSIDPRASWYGSYDRRLGTATMIACGVAFLFAARLDATGRVRVRRAIALLGTVLAGYALLQWCGLEPLPVARPSDRAFATLGNPIFLGSTLLVTLFVTAGEAAAAWRDSRERTRGTGPAPAPWKRLGAATLLQLLALAASGSRGPFLGLVAGLGAAAAMALRWVGGRGHLRLRRLAAATGFVVLAAGVVVAANPRLASLSPWGGPNAGTARFRLQAWGTFSDMLLWQAREGTAMGGVPAPARVLVGFGPETLDRAVWPWQQRTFAGTSFARQRLDRSHNEFLDEFARGGSLGLTAMLLLWHATLVAWSRRAGLLVGAAAARRYARRVALCTGGLLAVAVTVTRSLQWLGVVLAAGALGGWALSALWQVRWAGRVAKLSRGVPQQEALAACGIVAGLLAHLVEIQFGFVTVSTALLFWVLAGMAVQAQRSGTDARVAAHPSAWPDAALGGLALLVLLLDSAGASVLSSSTVGNLGALLNGGSAGLARAPLWLLLAGVLGVCLVPRAGEGRGARSRRSRSERAARWAMLVGPPLGAALLQSLLLARVASATGLARVVRMVTLWRTTWFWLAVALVFVWGTLALSRWRIDASASDPRATWAPRPAPRTRSPGTAAVAGVAAWSLVLALLAGASAWLPAARAPSPLRCAEAGVLAAFARTVPASYTRLAAELGVRAAVLCPEVPGYARTDALPAPRR